MLAREALLLLCFLARPERPGYLEYLEYLVSLLLLCFLDLLVLSNQRDPLPL